MLVVVMTVLAVAVTYASAVATGCIFRDDTISFTGKSLRVLGVWLFPLVGAMLVLRSAAELSPASLPDRQWLSPLRLLIYVKPRRFEQSGPDDQVQATERVLPGSTFHDPG